MPAHDAAGSLGLQAMPVIDRIPREAERAGESRTSNPDLGSLAKLPLARGSDSLGHGWAAQKENVWLEAASCRVGVAVAAVVHIQAHRLGGCACPAARAAIQSREIRYA